jgi:sugar-specific transcriptional regulator TrmB
MLQTVGITEFEERVYRALLRQPGTSVAATARDLSASHHRVRRALEDLEERDLVHHSEEGEWLAAAPDVALEALIRRRESELAQLRAETRELLEEFRTGHLAHQPEELLEVVVGRDQIHRRAQEARRLTRTELLSFDKPPYIAPNDFDELTEERALFDRGIRVRAIYCTTALADSPWPDRLRRIRQLVAEGEQARTLPSLPIKLTIYDNRLALVPLTVDAHATDSMVVVHESGLLDGLIALFEAHWRIAHPIGARGDGGGQPLTADERIRLVRKGNGGKGRGEGETRSPRPGRALLDLGHGLAPPEDPAMPARLANSASDRPASWRSRCSDAAMTSNGAPDRRSSSCPIFVRSRRRSVRFDERRSIVQYRILCVRHIEHLARI